MSLLYRILTVFVLFFVSFGTFAFSYDGMLRVEEISDVSVGLSWDSSEDAAHYIVYYDYTDTIDPDDPQYFEQSDLILETQTTIQGLESDTSYSFVVASVDAFGNESDTYSQPAQVKTFKKMPDFELSNNEIQVLEPKVVQLPFTRVVDVQSDIEVRITHVPTNADLHVKGYLPGIEDLRNVQVFLSDSLRRNDEYRVEVVSINDSAGNPLPSQALRSRTFQADFAVEEEE